MGRLSESYSSDNDKNIPVKVFGNKKTLGITLSTNLIEKARKHGLNISRITEQALNSIIDYLETQNNQTSSNFLSQGSFPKESEWTEIGLDTRLNPRMRFKDALSSLLPLLPAKQRKIDEPDDWLLEVFEVECPDPKGRMIWEITCEE